MEFSAKMLIQRWQRAEEANWGGEALTVSNRVERTPGGVARAWRMGSAAAQARTGARVLIVTQSRTEEGRGENLASLLLSLSLHHNHHWLTRSLLKEETGKCSFQGKDRKWSRSVASMPLLKLLQPGLRF